MITTTLCPPYAHMSPPGRCSAPIHLCSAPIHLALLGISTEHVELLFPGEKCVSEPPSASPLHDWMVKGEPESFIGVLCTSWVFYWDANKRNEDGNMPYRPLFFARVTSENHEPFIMRMSAEWFKAAKAHMDLPSLGRSVHHVKGQYVQRTLTLEVHHRSVDKDDHRQATTNRFRRMANICERIPCASSLQQSTPQESNRNLSQGTKSEARQKSGKTRNRPMKTTEPIKTNPNRSESIYGSCRVGIGR
jgi:hypothetical protein